MFRLTRDNWLEVMGERPTTALWGVGDEDRPGSSRPSASAPSRDLAAVRPGAARRPFGPDHAGPTSAASAAAWPRHGPDDTPWVARAHGRETTFQENLTQWSEVEREVRVLAGRVAEDLRAEGRPAQRVLVKMRYAPFETHTASRAITPRATRRR